MQILELELAKLAIRRLSRESLGQGIQQGLRLAIDAHQMMVRAEETVQLGEQAGLISLQLGYEQILARLYRDWLHVAELLSDQMADVDGNKLAAKLRHSMAQTQDWLEVHDGYSRQFAASHEAEALVLL